MSDNVFIHKEAFNVLTGDQIGRGVARSVHACKLDPTLVVKIEDGAGSFQNVAEWNVWEAVKETEWAKWFAPCVAISPCGSVLLMKRTTPVSRGAYPERLPRFLTDCKFQNYGEIDGRFVCHDYGMNLLLENGMSNRMRNVHWWDAA